jgi:hypothetical protein
MPQVRVLQGCSIEVSGVWHNQGAVLDVPDPSQFTRTLIDDSGKPQVLPCVRVIEVEKPRSRSPKLPALPEED